MGYFVWIGILTIAAMVAAAFVIGGALRDAEGANRAGGLLGIGVIYATVFAISTLFATYNQVDAGHVGVVYAFGNIIGERGSGANFLPPWQSLIEVNVQEQKAKFANPKNADDKTALGDIDAASAETQNVYFDVTVNWRLDRGRVQELYRTVGPNFFEVLVRSRVQELFKNEAVKYPAIEITVKRQQIGDNVVKALNGELAPYGLTIVSIQTDNISYSDAFDQAIEQKQVATQQALRAQELVKQAEATAKQVEATAKGAAQAEIAKADGDAQAILLRAKAQADANRQLSASLTPEVLKAQAIANLANVKWGLLPAGANFLTDPASLLGALK